jgi:Holliday junction DNA helicase RuvB
VDELLTTAEAPGDAELDASLRPRHLGEFLGQETVKEQLGLVLDGAKRVRSSSLRFARAPAASM